MKKIFLFLCVLFVLAFSFFFSISVAQDPTYDWGTLPEVVVTAPWPSPRPIPQLTVPSPTIDFDAARENLQRIVAENNERINNERINNEHMQQQQKEQISAVDCSVEKLQGLGCQFNMYDMLGIHQSSTSKTERTSVSTFVQDVILAATVFIGTVVTLAFIISGLMFVFSAVNSGMRQKAQSGMKNAVIGFVLVLSAYAIIRLIQYIAAG